MFLLGLWECFIAAVEHRWFHHFWKYGRIYNTDCKSFQRIPIAKSRILHRTQAFVCIFEEKKFLKQEKIDEQSSSDFVFHCRIHSPFQGRYKCYNRQPRVHPIAWQLMKKQMNHPHTQTHIVRHWPIIKIMILISCNFRFFVCFSFFSSHLPSRRNYSTWKMNIWKWNSKFYLLTHLHNSIQFIRTFWQPRKNHVEFLTTTLVRWQWNPLMHGIWASCDQTNQLLPNSNDYRVINIILRPYPIIYICLISFEFSIKHMDIVTENVRSLVITLKRLYLSIHKSLKVIGD